MDGQRKAKLEQRAIGVLVVVFGVMLTGALRSVGVFGRHVVRTAVSSPKHSVRPEQPTLRVAVEEYRKRMEPQPEAPVPVLVAEPPPEPTYTAYELRDPLRSLLPREPEPEREVDIPIDPSMASGGESSPRALPNLVVQGVWWGGGEPKAIINDEVYGVGDTVAGATVTAIDGTGVSIDFSGETLHLAPARQSTGQTLSQASPWR